MEGIRPPTPSHKSVVVDNGGKQAHLGGNCDSTSRECLQETFGWVHSVFFVGNQVFEFIHEIPVQYFHIYGLGAPF